MSIGVNIEDFSHEQLKELVLGLQNVIQSERVKREMSEIRTKSLEMENAVLRDMLGRQIVGIVVAPTMISSGTVVNRAEEGETGEEETTPVIVDEKDKDKFQA